MEYNLTRTWDSQIPVERPTITITITPTPTQEKQRTGDGEGDKGLLITVDAPFFNDPKLPPDVGNVPGRVDGLWDYEVVEVFLLGEEDKYLEIELGPKGHYLVYSLHGVRNVTQPDLILESYSATTYPSPGGVGSCEEKSWRWRGEAFIPFHYLPQNLTKFNAYAIYKSNQERTYMALFPVPPGKFTQPDFHRLESFQPIDLRWPSPA